MSVDRSAIKLSPGESGGIEDRLNEIKHKGLFRRRLSISSAQSTRVDLEGKELLNFCSNDYLGLANDLRIVTAFQEAAGKYGVGSGASPLVCGRSTAHSVLEEEVARITGRDRAILFSSGYLANLAIISTLAPGRADMIFQDKLNHASLIDAAALSHAKLKRYPHRDLKALTRSLDGNIMKRKLILTDAVFSMDGDFAPLADLATISKEHNASLIVDDAHGFGVYGENGGGTLERAGLGQAEVPLMMATFGKAAGCGGAFVAGSEALIELMVQKARPYIYSTAMVPALAVAATESLRLITEEPWRRQHLQVLIERFRRQSRQAGLVLQDSVSPIQPLVVGSAKRAVDISEALLEAGILLTAIRPPTVPINTARLRITLSAGHSEEDVDILINALLVCGVNLN